MALDKAALRDLYARRAQRYDFTANLYYLIGFREARYRKRAVAALKLTPGGTVVEVGCGTGLNFRYLRDGVGNGGSVIGVDQSEAMLKKARNRVDRQNWNNVQLIQQDAATYKFPGGIDGVISTFALTLVPEYDQLIASAAKALKPGKRFVVLDLKLPQRFPMSVIKAAVAVTKPFGVTLDLAERKPWEAMERHLAGVTIAELYGGFAYIAVGASEQP